jgi:hypothetical protein
MKKYIIIQSNVQEHIIKCLKTERFDDPKRKLLNKTALAQMMNAQTLE